MLNFSSFFTKKFNNVFHSDNFTEVSKSDVKTILRHEIVKHKKNSNNSFIPNHYEFFLPTDQIETQDIYVTRNELFTFLLKELIINDCFIAGNVFIQVKEQNDIASNEITINSCFEEKIQNIKCEKTETIILDKTQLSSAMLSEKEMKSSEYVALEVLEGAEKGLCIYFGGERIDIGRHDRKGLALNDVSVSRHHASIKFENNRHLLCDSNSLNGTFVNDKKIDQAYLKQDDMVKIGNVLLKYSLIQ